MPGGASTPSTVAQTGAPSGAAPRRGVAFGLRISGAFPAPGLWTGAGTAARCRASLEIVPPETLTCSWSEVQTEQILRLPAGGNRPDLLVEAHPTRGYLVRAEGFGAYLIAADGRRVRLAAGQVEDWRWQRLLTAQVLPIAALLQGLELLHASAVQLRGRVLAFTGAGSGGKTTLAARLLLAGANFVTDDVLAIERVDDEVIAHPGPALMNLRLSKAGIFDARERARLGAELGRDGGGARLRVTREGGCVPAGRYLLPTAPQDPQGGCANRAPRPARDLAVAGCSLRHCDQDPDPPGAAPRPVRPPCSTGSNVRPRGIPAGVAGRSGGGRSGACHAVRLVSSIRRIPRPERLSPAGKLALSAEILVVYAKACWALRRRSLPDVASAIRLAADSAHGWDEDPSGTGVRLGAAVTRLLGVLPRDPRCLRKSLVLTELLARRGIAATLVIGVRADPFAAHAWVEQEGRPLLPPATAPFERLVELSTWPPR